MRRYRMMIKGSKEELQWLNKQAQRGWLLSGVRGNWYEFQATTKRYRLFSEYVTPDVATEMAGRDPIFELLARAQLKDPAIQVIYTGSTQPEVQKARVNSTDAQMQLKLALALRGHLLNVMNIVLFSGLGLAIILIFTNLFPVSMTTPYLVVWLGCAYIPARAAARIHRQSNALRVQTQQYDGAWKPTMHVFLKNMSAELDLEKVAELGDWTLVGHDKKGFYWYDLHTLASTTEIKQTLQPVVGPDVDVTVMSWLGLAPIGFII